MNENFYNAAFLFKVKYSFLETFLYKSMVLRYFI